MKLFWTNCSIIDKWTPEIFTQLDTNSVLKLHFFWEIQQFFLYFLKISSSLKHSQSEADFEDYLD